MKERKKQRDYWHSKNVGVSVKLIWRKKGLVSGQKTVN